MTFTTMRECPEDALSAVVIDKFTNRKFKDTTSDSLQVITIYIVSKWCRDITSNINLTTNKSQRQVEIGTEAAAPMVRPFGWITLENVKSH